jgi:molecular chaperone Hsp33
MTVAHDQIARCVLDGAAVRVVAVCATGAAREAARRHRADAGVATALGRAAAAGLLLATFTKDEERVTLQLLGDGPLGAVTVDAAASGGVRAFVKNPALRIPAQPWRRVALGAFMGRHGVVNVVRDLGLKESFSGSTVLTEGDVDGDVENYLVASEQIDSALGCEALLNDDLVLAAVGGVLVQALPGGADAPLLAAARARLRAGCLADLLRAPGGPPSAEALAAGVLGDDAAGMRALDVRPVRFACPCSRARAVATLALLGRQELVSLLEDDGGATVECQFCRESYRFTAADVDAATEAARPEPA